MTVIVALQLGLNLVLLGAWIFEWRSRRSAAPVLPAPERAEIRDLVETGGRRLEEELRSFQGKAEAQIRALMRIGEEASRLLRKAQLPWPTTTPTAEECELRAALTVESHGAGDDRALSRIPTLADLEKTRQRLKSDISVDLKTLLKDQLA